MASPTNNFTTYSGFKDASASEKTALCILEAARRLVGWSVYSGSIYSIDFSDSNVISSVEDDGVALTEVSGVASVTAGKYYFDRDNGTLYARLSDSSNPDDSFIAVVFKYFFSNNGVKAPWNLSTGFDVYWRPLLTTTSEFRLEVDNKDTQLGLAIEGSGTVKFLNDQGFWAPIYDHVFFENQLMTVYSWERTLPITQAQILFRGRIQGKTYSPSTIQFQAKDVLNSLRDSFELDTVGNFTYSHTYFSGTVSARVNDSDSEALQRLIYGKCFGVKAMNVDQILPDTPERRISFETGYRRHNDGTFDVTNSSKLVQANGTFRTADIMPGDQLLFSNDLDNLYTVDYYTSLFDMVLTEDFQGATSTTVTARIFPQRPRRLHNRHFLVAGHPLSEFTTTVQQVIDGRHFYVADASGLLVGDNIIVNAGGTDYDRVIGAITDTSLITTTVLISPTPSVGESVKRPGVQKVYIDKQLLIQGQDYTVDSQNAMVILDSSNPDSVTGLGNAEFNHTKVSTFSGRVTFTSGDFSVTKSTTPHSSGETTSFNSQFRPGDYIQQPDGVWREVWYVIDDDSLVLSGLASQSADSENGLMKSVEYFDDSTNLICDVRGKTSDRTTTGTWLRKAPQIVSSILADYGVSADTGIDQTSFDNASSEVPFDVSLIIPPSVTDKKASSIRDSISKLNRSVFGTLLQNSNLQLAYAIISADKTSLTSFDRADVVDFLITSDSSKLIKSAKLFYDEREVDFTTLSSSNKFVSQTSDVGQYLLKLAREFTVDTLLISSQDATITVGRWAFLLELATSRLTSKFKLNASTLSVGDAVEVNHPKLYDRYGSAIKRRLGNVSLVSRGPVTSSIVLDDLSNAYTRVATISAADAADYTSATDSEEVVSGYITQANGLLGGDPETYGLNLIW